MVAIGYAEHQPKKDEMAIGIPGGGMPFQIQALVQISDPMRIGGFRLRNEGDESVTGDLVGRGATTPVVGEAIGALGALTYAGLLVHKNIVAGTLAITDAGTGEIMNDNGDGTMTGTAGGVGTIDYDTGAYSVTFNVAATGAVTGAYSTTGWVELPGIADFTYVAGGGAGYAELEPTLGDTYMDSIKGHTLLGIRGWTTGFGTQLRVGAIHFGNDESVKLQEPPELRGEGT